MCGTPTREGVERPTDAPSERPPFNALAILAIVLALVAGPFALVFGHIALAQIRTSGERGRVLAIIATVLGYLWLAAALVLTYVYVAQQAR